MIGFNNWYLWEWETSPAKTTHPMVRYRPSRPVASPWPWSWVSSVPAASPRARAAWRATCHAEAEGWPKDGGPLGFSPQGVGGFFLEDPSINGWMDGGERFPVFSEETSKMDENWKKSWKMIKNGERLLNMNKNDATWMEHADINYEKWDLIVKMWEFK